VFTHKLESTHDLSFIVKTERVLKVTGTHVHFKNGIISESVMDRDVKILVPLKTRP